MDDQDRFFDLSRLVRGLDDVVQFYPQAVDTARNKVKKDKYDQLLPFLDSLDDLDPRLVLGAVQTYSNILTAEDLCGIERDTRKAYGIFLDRLASRYRQRFVDFEEERVPVLNAIFNTEFNVLGISQGNMMEMDEIFQLPGFQWKLSAFSEDNPEVSWYQPKVPAIDSFPYMRVVMDLTARVAESIVMKMPRKEVEKGEWGRWVDADPVSRLERDFRTAGLVGDLCGRYRIKRWRAITPISMVDVGFNSIYFQEKENGVPFDKWKGKSDKVEVAKKVVRALAEFHHYSAEVFREDFPKVDYNNEFKAIAEMVGMKVGLEAYAPFVDILDISRVELSGYCHNSFHSSNVLIDGELVVIPDWELTSVSFVQDDLIRLLEGPVKFSDEEKEEVLGAYFRKRQSFFPHWRNRDYCIWEKFNFVYDVRRPMMHLWAAKHLLDNGEEKAAEANVRKCFSAIENIREQKKDYGRKGLPVVVSIILRETDIDRLEWSLKDGLKSSYLQSVSPWSR